MQTWKSLIQAGNEYFQNADYEEAEQHYIQACERVGKLYPHWPDAEEAVAATLAAYHNLAECLKCQGRYTVALEALQKVHHLFGESLKTPHCDPLLCEALMCGRRRARTELMTYRRQMHLVDGGSFRGESHLPIGSAVVEKYA